MVVFISALPRRAASRSLCRLAICEENDSIALSSRLCSVAAAFLEAVSASRALESWFFRLAIWYDVAWSYEARIAQNSVSPDSP